MYSTFILTEEMYNQLWGHLLQSDQEQVAFVFAEAVMDDGEVTFRAQDLYLVSPEELLVQRSFHVSLTDEAQARVIKLAWDKRLALVEIHSHPCSAWPAEFSPSDLYGLAEFVPHVRWRLQRQPYLALVVAPSDFDALLWVGESPEGLDAVSVGDRILVPTGLGLRALSTRKTDA